MNAKRSSLLFLIVLVILSGDVFGQHDPGRNAVRLLARSQTDDAIKLVAQAPRRMNSPISDAERDFVLAMAACQQGDVDKALDYVKSAVDKGLPVERIQAGPRDILNPALLLLSPSEPAGVETIGCVHSHFQHL